MARNTIIGLYGRPIVSTVHFCTVESRGSSLREAVAIEIIAVVNDEIGGKMISDGGRDAACPTVTSSEVVPTVTHKSSGRGTLMWPTARLVARTVKGELVEVEFVDKKKDKMEGVQTSLKLSAHSFSAVHEGHQKCDEKIETKDNTN